MIFDASGTTAYKYDARGRLIEEKRTLWGVDYTTGFAYDPGDRLVTITYPTGETVTRTYNDRGLPAALTGSATGDIVTGIQYNQLGQITRINLGNGAETIYGYWGVGGTNDYPGGYYGRLYQIKTVKESSTLQHLIHIWDPSGNLLLRADLTSGEGEMLQYDFLDRLTSVTGTYSQSYTYDTIGNITSMNGQSYTYGSKPHAVTAVGATTYEYDANGNMTARGTQALVWNVEHQLINVSSEAGGTYLFYDGDGNRFFKYEWGNGSFEATIYVNQYFEKNLSTSEVTTHYFLGGKEVASKKGERGEISPR